MFGALGRAISRPFKDIHKAVTTVGKGVGKAIRPSGGMMKKILNPLNIGRKKKPAMESSESPGTAAVKETAPQKISGSSGKKPGEWRGSTYLGSGPKPEDTPQQKKKKPLIPVGGSKIKLLSQK